MMDKESTWDKLLQIETSGRDDSNSGEYCYPYDPTPYCVLECLADGELLGQNNVVSDYVCGKGWVDFFLSFGRCSFFSFFSLDILHKVMARILESYYESPREFFIFLLSVG